MIPGILFILNKNLVDCNECGLKHYSMNIVLNKILMKENSVTLKSRTSYKA